MLNNKFAIKHMENFVQYFFSNYVWQHLLGRCIIAKELSFQIRSSYSKLEFFKLIFLLLLDVNLDLGSNI